MIITTLTLLLLLLYNNIIVSNLKDYRFTNSLVSPLLFVFSGSFWLPPYSWAETALYCGSRGRGWSRTGSRQAAFALQHGRKLKPFCSERHVRGRATPFRHAPPLPLSNPRLPRTQPLPPPSSQWGAVPPCDRHGPRQPSSQAAHPLAYLCQSTRPEPQVRTTTAALFLS